ncbi:iron-siderophore ABC transporter substrate-binding protein [Paenibacillus thalictri]|nr:iron-siderophore ABC transporter substrate-binding protein [Paenibacillus thalictri]
MSSYKRTSFGLPILLALLLVLSACGGYKSDTAKEAAGSSKPAEQSAAAETKSAATPAPAPAAPTPAAAPADAKKRTITHTLGQTEVPAAPTRVIALTQHFTDHLVSLGIVPVGSAVREAGDFEPYIASQLKGSESIGQAAAPNLEKVLQLKPDLIIGTEKYHVKSYEALGKIAPTIIYGEKDMEGDWPKVFLSIGEAVGKADLAKQKLQEFNDKTKSLKEKLAAKVGDKTVVFFKVSDKDTRILGNKSPFGKIAYEQLGLKYPAGLPDETNEVKIALEKLPEINPDYIFLMDINVPEYVDKMNQTIQTPLWKSLRAVQDKHMYMEPYRSTGTGFSLTLYNMMVDAVGKELLSP